jgi:hypothetical protein
MIASICDPVFNVAPLISNRRPNVGFTGNFWVDVHMVWRWVMLAVALVTVVKALIGWLGKQPWTKLDDKLGLFFTIAVDIQFLLGLILWFAGPFKITNAGALMSSPLARFYLVEHPLLMLVALVLAHIGRNRSREAEPDVQKHKTAFIFYLLSFLFILLIFILRISIR